jgi:molecular chaperone DnaK
MADNIIGIDLGTTNSEVAALVHGHVQVLASDGEQIMPSVVGFSPDGRLLVGTPARNQYVLYPERTVRSIKRLMGSDQRVALGEQTYTPPEISAMILRALKTRAETVLGAPVSKAVITVPAYFSDAQRQATRDAGQIAGLEVVRILNEPTAAALAYGADRQGERTILVYDLGGGTFDVSLVQVHDDITEVLASHGNNHLGGDDFDQLLLDFVHNRFVDTGGVDIRADRRAMPSRKRKSGSVSSPMPVCARSIWPSATACRCISTWRWPAANTNNSFALSLKERSTACIAPSPTLANGQTRLTTSSLWAAPPVPL